MRIGVRKRCYVPFVLGILIGISFTLFYRVNFIAFGSPEPPLFSHRSAREQQQSPSSTRTIKSPNIEATVQRPHRIRKHRGRSIRPETFVAENASTHSPMAAPEITAHLLSDGISTAAEEWAPVVYDYCDRRWMPSKYAPCMKEAQENPHLLKKEELVYPDFKLAMPNFINDEYREFWVAKLKKQTDRIRWQPSGGIYAGQHGQNLVFGPGEYSNLPTSGWNANTCMSGAVRHVFAYRPLRSTKEVRPTIIVATSPDSGYFQHFLDRVMHVLTQGESHYGLNAGLMLGAYSVPQHIHKLIKLLGLVHDGSFANSVKVSKSLVFSCRAPLIHPYLSLRLREKLNVVTNVPLAQRKVVLYVTRKQSRNGGRRVVNEAELLKQVRAFLQQRQQNEELVIFDESNFNSLPDMVEWFGKNVLAIFGPHGGSWYNQRWAGKDTLLIEFVPKNRHEIMFWEEAQILSQNYWAMTLESLNAAHDMQVPVAEVLEILTANLGKQNPSGPTLTKHYNWDVPQ